MSGSSELADALRHWRERLTPAAAGLAANGPRRVPGLRREEVALLAGVSVDYIIRLERARFRTPSGPVCSALARALQLSDAEQDHLFRLAGHASGPSRVSQLIPASVRRFVDRMDDRPVSVYDAVWNLLSWNPMWAAALGDPSEATTQQRNVVWRTFFGSQGRVRHTEAEQHRVEASLVADLRTASSRYPQDPSVGRLVDELRDSARFRELWLTNDIGDYEQDHKLIEHPYVGLLDIDCDVLSNWRHDLRIVVYTAHTDDTASKLGLLATIGQQDMASTTQSEPERTRDH